MRGLLLVFMSVVAVGAVTVYDLVMDEWKLYKIAMKRNFDSAEEEHLRLRTFLEAKDLVARHNARFLKGLENYELSVNQFADKDLYEGVDLNRIMNRFMDNNDIAMMRNAGMEIIVPEDETLPDFVDWSASGAVSHVVNQGNCGSCYAIATAEAMEGQIFISTSTLPTLSFQQILDCSTPYGNKGCNGGTFSRTLRYLESTGLASFDDYPYEKKTSACRLGNKNVSLPVKNFYYKVRGSEEVLKYAVAKYGPVAAAINASPRSLHLYKSGIYSDASCNSIPTHAVLITGYGTDKRTKRDYWIVKNSWGSRWGEKGYVKFERNVNMCGVSQMIYVPRVV